MIKNNQNPNEWLAVLHNSLNLFGVIFLTVIWAENSIDDSFWSSVPLIIFFAYGVFSGLMHGEKSKYILFRKSFWIVLLVTILSIISGGFLFLEEEYIYRWGYLNLLIRNIIFSALFILPLFMGTFLVGYIMGGVPKSLKYLMEKLKYY